MQTSRCECCRHIQTDGVQRLKTSKYTLKATTPPTPSNVNRINTPCTTTYTDHRAQAAMWDSDSVHNRHSQHRHRSTTRPHTLHTNLCSCARASPCIHHVGAPPHDCTGSPHRMHCCSAFSPFLSQAACLAHRSLQLRSKASGTLSSCNIHMYTHKACPQAVVCIRCQGVCANNTRAANRGYAYPGNLRRCLAACASVVLAHIGMQHTPEHGMREL